MFYNKLLSKIFNACSGNSGLKSASLRNTSAKYISTTARRDDLNEFFDIKENWGVPEVKSGRGWTKDDLRIKSNEDLHKLWYILLKERNMLLTMEEEAKEQVKLFPSPERLDKVRDSMKNLEDVVRERNKAYHLLETGKDGERPVEKYINPFGMNATKRLYEYPLPKHMNKKWLENHVPYKENNKDIQQFQLKLGENTFMYKKRKRTRDFNHVIGLLNRFPNMDMEALKGQYPDVDIEKAKRSRKYKGWD
ncbi:hypothetical protein WA026_003403 [Henosepilachna vigintioctopunctata]|uniref:Large ribosomal subunit protein uL29m n=1 Tax=Henosepilachna vigintioctopunctata TaxID=420089 RepID=A0AAW1TM19_9CUCU